MHLFFIVRGVQHQVDQWKMWMQTTLWPWRVKDKETGQEDIMAVQGALRPIQLYEFVFPEEHLQEVLTMMNFSEGKTGYWGKGWAKYMLAPLRKILGAKPIPTLPPSPRARYIYREGVGLEGIGIKSDAKGETHWDTPAEQQKKEKSLFGNRTKIKEHL